jgi:hypothetical protein
MSKHVLAAAAIVFATASVADAQIGFSYERTGDNYRLRIGGYWGGGYSGYGYGGYGYGGGYYGGYSPGFTWSNGNSSFAFGTNFLGSNYGWPGTGYGYGSTVVYGDGFGYSSGWVLPRRAYYGYPGGSYADYVAMSYTSARRAAMHGVPEYVQRLTLSKHLETGVKKFQFADYAGALASFKEAVGTDTSAGLAQVYMGIALVATGDFKNAEKALSSGIPAAPEFGSVDLKAMFKDAKEQAKFVAALDKAGPMSGALGYGLLGDKAKARARAGG